MSHPRTIATHHQTLNPSAVAGSLASKDALTQYGVSEKQAEELRSCMPSQVASAGDVVGYDGCYLVHRCSCHGGMTGSPLPVLQQPLAIVGIHLGGGTSFTIAREFADDVIRVRA